MQAEEEHKLKYVLQLKIYQLLLCIEGYFQGSYLLVEANRRICVGNISEIFVN